MVVPPGLLLLKEAIIMPLDTGGARKKFVEGIEFRSQNSGVRIRRNITQAAAGNAMGVIDPKNNIHRRDTLKMSTTPPAPHEEQSWYYIVKIPRP
jgi:hypothetical protein